MSIEQISKLTDEQLKKAYHQARRDAYRRSQHLQKGSVFEATRRAEELFVELRHRGLK